MFFVCTVGIKRRKSSDSEYENEDDVVVKRVKLEPGSEEDMSGVRKVERVTPNKGRGRPLGKSWCSSSYCTSSS